MINAEAKSTKARYFSPYFWKRTSIFRKRLYQESVRLTPHAVLDAALHPSAQRFLLVEQRVETVERLLTDQTDEVLDVDALQAMTGISRGHLSEDL